MLEMTQLISMVLKDSGVMPKHGYIIIEGVPKPYFDFYLKEIEFRFNHRKENIFKILIQA